MKNIVHFGLFVFCAVILSLNTYGQSDSVIVKRSDDKVIIGGQPYYIHIVEKGHTLYSISKAYNVSQKAIARENPDVFMGLRPGQALKIPYEPKKADQFQEKDTTKYRYHKVIKGQTLYSLSKRYDVPQDVIKEYNPVLYEESLKAGQTLKLPKEKQEDKIVQSQADTIKGKEGDQRKGNYIYHRVKKKETLYSLSKKYDVDIEDIKEANEYLRRDELKYGSVIRIPLIEKPESSTLFTEMPGEVEEEIEDYSLQYQQIKELSVECDSSNYYKRKGLNVTLFLPLYTSKNYEEFYIDSSEVDDQGEKIYKKIMREDYYIYPGAENFIEFYEGMLIALDSVKDRGVKINLRVFDTKKNPDHVRTILFTNDFRDTDLIIGPVYKNSLNLVADFAKENDIDIISPFAKDPTRLKDNENYIQVYPSREAQLERFASFVSQFNDKNMILVHTGDSLYYPEIREFRNTLFSYINQDTSLNDVRFKEVPFKDSLFYLEQAVNMDEENYVIVPSEDEAFVTDVVTNLNTLVKKDYKVKVFGYSAWKDFVNLDQEYFYNLNLTLFTPFHVDYSRDAIKNVIKKYRKTYKSEPSRFVFHGFDIGYYFFNAMHRFGKDYKNCMYAYDPELCHSDYQFFRRSEDYGIENVSIFVLRYNNDYTIRKIKLSNEPSEKRKEIVSGF